MNSIINQSQVPHYMNPKAMTLISSVVESDTSKVKSRKGSPEPVSFQEHCKKLQKQIDVLNQAAKSRKLTRMNIVKEKKTAVKKTKEQITVQKDLLKLQTMKCEQIETIYNDLKKTMGIE